MRPEHVDELVDVLRELVAAHDHGTRLEEATTWNRARRLLARIGRDRGRV